MKLSVGAVFALFMVPFFFLSEYYGNGFWGSRAGQAALVLLLLVGFAGFYMVFRILRVTGVVSAAYPRGLSQEEARRSKQTIQSFFIKMLTWIAVLLAISFLFEHYGSRI